MTSESKVVNYSADHEFLHSTGACRELLSEFRCERALGKNDEHFRHSNMANITVGAQKLVNNARTELR